MTSDGVLDGSGATARFGGRSTADRWTTHGEEPLCSPGVLFIMASDLFQRQTILHLDHKGYHEGRNK